MRELHGARARPCLVRPRRRRWSDGRPGAGRTGARGAGAEAEVRARPGQPSRKPPPVAQPEHSEPRRTVAIQLRMPAPCLCSVPTRSSKTWVSAVPGALGAGKSGRRPRCLGSQVESEGAAPLSTAGGSLGESLAGPPPTCRRLGYLAGLFPSPRAGVGKSQVLWRLKLLIQTSCFLQSWLTPFPLVEGAAVATLLPRGSPELRDLDLTGLTIVASVCTHSNSDSCSFN